MNPGRYAVILAGGRGERFWPLSRVRRPKQLLSLVGERTLLGQAVDRLQGLMPPEHILVITNADLVEASRAAVPELPPGNVLGEPVGRDTAPAVALAAALVKARDPQGVFCILTADHVMGDLPLYQATLEGAMALAQTGDHLLTIGMKPTEPSTAYGYIERSDLHSRRGEVSFYRAQRFVEKPDRATATGYIETGRYLWNSGMFVWSVPALERALRTHRPSLVPVIDVLTPLVGRPGFEEALARVYGAIEKISIDYAIMEKANNILVAEGRFAWDDVGSWTALANHFPADSQGNVVVGDCAALHAASNIVYSKDRLTALIGVRDLIVVQAEDVTLVCRRDQAQDIKKLLEQVRAGGHTGVL